MSMPGTWQSEINPDRAELRAAWEQFVSHGTLNPDLVRQEILESWERCKSYGLDPYAPDICAEFNAEDKERIFQEKHFLMKTARPFLQGLYKLIRSMEMVVFLTDQCGFILEALGDGPIWEYCQAKNAVVGSSFNERFCGTTAPGIALRLDSPYQMVAEEHYLESIHVASCAAAPIHDEFGNIVACLDITSSYDTALKHPHTLGMIVAAAQVIENQLRLTKELERSRVAGEYLRAATQTMEMGLIILDQQHKVTHMNPAAERILGVSREGIEGSNIQSLVGNETIVEVLNRGGQLEDREILLRESADQSRFLTTIRPIFDQESNPMGNLLLLKEFKAVQRLMQKMVGFEARYTFEDIWGESREIVDTIALARQVAKTASNVVLVGESGTGKEMFAQGIHNAGPFARGPFLGVNCAAIPNDLIESELFGYEPGTFTGALRSGKPGRLELACDGTLLLDEVNCMPPDMQAKLLRVLEERRFLRLGGKHYISLRARIIAASNQNLQDEMSRGNFRSDLYYRLCVMEIRVPPLRIRKGDIPVLADRFIEQVSRRLNKEVYGLSPAALAYLESQPWPGNVRQLLNWIERAVSLSESQILQVNNFPQEEPMKARPRLEALAQPRPDPDTNLGTIERVAIRKVVEQCDGNLSKASQQLGISRATLYRKMNRYNITVEKTVTC